MQTAKMASATDVQNNFGEYLQYTIDHGQVVITRNGKRVARIVSETESVQYLTDSLRGILKRQYSDEDVRTARAEMYMLQMRMSNMRVLIDTNIIMDVIAKLDAIFTIADMKGDDFKKTAGFPMDDFENALQSVCATRLKVDFIVTRNLKDPKNSKVMAIKPNELIERIAE